MLKAKMSSHEGFPRRSRHRCEGRRTPGIAAAPTSGWEGRNDTRAALALVPCRRLSGAVRTARTSGARQAVPVRRDRTWRRRSSHSLTTTPGASNKRPASRASTAPRSNGLIPRSLTESSTMLSWRGAADGSAGVGRFLMLLPMDDVWIVPRASSETAFDQQMMKVDQRRHCYARRADRHAGAGDGVQHPCGEGRCARLAADSASAPLPSIALRGS
jgi:hypothetical protein